MRRRYLNSTEKIVSLVTNNQNLQTYPTFQFKWVYRRELNNLTPGIISLYTEDFSRVMHTNLSYGGSAICRVRWGWSKVIRRLGYKGTRAATFQIRILVNWKRKATHAELCIALNLDVAGE